MISNMISGPPKEEGKEKHIPDITVAGNTVTVKCGKDVMHPSTDAHHIVWMKLFGVDKEGLFRELGSTNPTPGDEPVVNFSIEIGNYKELHALIYCNLHGLWENKLDL
jgi:superoxide reductase